MSWNRPITTILTVVQLHSEFRGNGVIKLMTGQRTRSRQRTSSEGRRRRHYNRGYDASEKRESCVEVSVRLSLVLSECLRSSPMDPTNFEFRLRILVKNGSRVQKFLFLCHEKKKTIGSFCPITEESTFESKSKHPTFTRRSHHLLQVLH